MCCCYTRSAKCGRVHADAVEVMTGLGTCGSNEGVVVDERVVAQFGVL